MIILLNELTSSQIINRSKNADKKFSRYERRKYIDKVKVSRIGLLDIKEGSNDLNIYLYVDSASNKSVKYRVDLRLENFVTRFRQYALFIDPNVTIKKLIRYIKPFLNLELKEADIKVNCTCPDFMYRFRDSARNKKFYFGIDSSDEARGPNPNKINPNYEGSICKHIMKVLTRPSLWYEKVLRSLSNLLKNNHSMLVKKLDIPYN